MNGIFAIEKPSGITSNQFLMKLQSVLNRSTIFSKEIQRAMEEKRQQYEKETGQKASKRKLRKVSKVKLGHGGTLDPLASGVMVIGIGTGTKQLANYLSGTTKVYETEALFGASTTSGDVEGEIIAKTSASHLKWDELKKLESKFIGPIKQTPPIYAALKMNGKPLHEYAREGKPLPRKIEPREVTIYDLKIYEDSLSRAHEHQSLDLTSDKTSVDLFTKMNANLHLDTLYFSKTYCEAHGLNSEVADIGDPIPLTDEELSLIKAEGDKYRAPLLHMRAKVSSGTYIRSLVSDIGKALRSSCYMVKLQRIEQQEWSLDKHNVFQLQDFTDLEEQVWSKVLKQVLTEGAKVNVTKALKDAKEEIVQEHSKLSELVPVGTQAPDTANSMENKGLKRSIDDV